MVREFIQLGTLASLVVGIMFAPAASRAAHPATRIAFGANAIEPFGHTRFCSPYPDECASPDRQRVHYEPVPHERRQELATVNREINLRIIPTQIRERGPMKEWRLNPDAGNCTDFAVTKRHTPLARGWAPEVLLLAEVRLRSTGEHHLVLVARIESADLVLDNLQASVRDFADTLADYQWLRIQSSANPRFWNSVEVSHG
jgi:predicted transglutaminase-like cysteine proteinase